MNKEQIRYVMAEDKQYLNSAVGRAFSMALFLVFLVLKLTGVIDWSWWFITMPLWFGPAIVALFAIGALILVTLTAVFRK